MPFGAGRRVCIGSTFATVEATLLAAMIGRHLRFDLPSGAEVEAEASITLRPKHGLPMHVFHRRHDPVPEEMPEPDLAAV
jgi:cytochrome P450